MKNTIYKKKENLYSQCLKIFDKEKQENEEIYNSLRIERNHHYCHNLLFVNKLKELLSLFVTPEGAFPPDLVLQRLATEYERKAILEQFIDHISNLPLPEEEKYMPEGWHTGVATLKKNERCYHTTIKEFKMEILPASQLFERKRFASMTDSLNSNLDPLSLYYSKIISSIPFENREEIAAQSPSGRVIERLWEEEDFF